MDEEISNESQDEIPQKASDNKKSLLQELNESGTVINPAEEKGVISKKVDRQQEIPCENHDNKPEIKKPEIRLIKKAKITFFNKMIQNEGKKESYCFISPQAKQPAEQQNISVNEQVRAPTEMKKKLYDRIKQSHSQLKSIPKKQNIPRAMQVENKQEGNNSVICNKNYGGQHNELNVNISIVDAKISANLRNQVAAMVPVRNPSRHIAIAPPMKQQDKNNKMSSRSFSTRSISKGPTCLKDQKQLVIQRESIEPKLKLVERNASPIQNCISSIRSIPKKKGLVEINQKQASINLYYGEKAYRNSNISIHSASPTRYAQNDVLLQNAYAPKAFPDGKPIVNPPKGRRIWERKASVNASRRQLQDQKISQSQRNTSEQYEGKQEIDKGNAAHVINKIRYKIHNEKEKKK